MATNDFSVQYNIFRLILLTLGGTRGQSGGIVRWLGLECDVAKGGSQ